MPFTMTHLCIANNISIKLSKHIDNLPQFYLGSISPDAVHNRTNYISEYKAASHLCLKGEIWGMVSGNDNWIKNVLQFLDKHKNTSNNSFLLGYCTHILSDIYNNITVWTPFREKNKNELKKGYGGLYHTESNKIDINFALTCPERSIFWSNIEQSKAIDFEHLIFANEIEEQKTKILYDWYSDKEIQEISSNKIITYEETLQFIENASVFVIDMLQSPILCQLNDMIVN
jgi:hypothetical protein